MKTRWKILLRAAALAGCLAGGATGASAVEIGILRYEGGDWYSCAPSLRAFLARLGERHPELAASLAERGAAPDDRAFFQVPVYILNGHGDVLLTDAQAEALRRYLDGGGFLFANDDFGMDASFRKLVKRLYPDGQLVVLGADHPVFQSPYRLPQGIPKVHKHAGGVPAALGLYRGGRLVLFYAFNTDILDGWDPPETHRDSEDVREAAFRMGVNILWHALTR